MSIDHIFKRQSRGKFDKEIETLLNIQKANRIVGVVFGVVAGLIFLTSLYPLAATRNRYLPVAFLSVASLSYSICYGLGWKSSTQDQLIARSVLGILAHTSSFLAFYTALKRQHWSQYLLGLLIIPPGIVSEVLLRRRSSVYYIPYAALAYVSLLVINALALLGFAIHRHKASQGTDHWAKYSKLIVAPSLLISSLFSLVVAILNVPPARQTIFPLPLFRTGLAMTVIYGVAICVSLGLLGYYLIKEVHATGSGESAEKLEIEAKSNSHI